MTTFKNYREKKLKEIPPSIETSFGEHSRKKSDKPKSIETSFGEHSRKKSITEKVELPEGHKKNMHTPAMETHIHSKVAPLHDANMTNDHREAVSDYSDDSRPLNSLLHRHDQGHTVNTSNNDHERRSIGDLDSLLDNHKTTADMHVFTGVKFSPSMHFKQSQGKPAPTSVKLKMPAFTSTSTSLLMAKGFADKTSHPHDALHGVDSDQEKKQHVLKIHVPQGSHAISLMGHSFLPKEKEVLLHRGHTIEVHHVPEQIGEHSYLWHAKIVGHDKADLSKDAL